MSGLMQRFLLITTCLRNQIIKLSTNNVGLGWSSLSSWSDRCAYADTAEISTYIDEEFRNLGIGKKLEITIIEKARATGIHVIVARVAGKNKASEELNKKLGLIFIDTMCEVGKKC